MKVHRKPVQARQKSATKRSFTDFSKLSSPYSLQMLTEGGGKEKSTEAGSLPAGFESRPHVAHSSCDPPESFDRKAWKEQLTIGKYNKDLYNFDFNCLEDIQAMYDPDRFRVTLEGLNRPGSWQAVYVKEPMRGQPSKIFIIPTQSAFSKYTKKKDPKPDCEERECEDPIRIAHCPCEEPSETPCEDLPCDDSRRIAECPCEDDTLPCDGPQLDLSIRQDPSNPYHVTITNRSKDFSFAAYRFDFDGPGKDDPAFKKTGAGDTIEFTYPCPGTYKVNASLKNDCKWSGKPFTVSIPKPPTLNQKAQLKVKFKGCKFELSSGSESDVLDQIRDKVKVYEDFKRANPSLKDEDVYVFVEGDSLCKVENDTCCPGLSAIDLMHGRAKTVSDLIFKVLAERGLGIPSSNIRYTHHPKGGNEMRSMIYFGTRDAVLSDPTLDSLRSRSHTHIAPDPCP